jgi:transcriptional regulator with XRE-family HTH domain
MVRYIPSNIRIGENLRRAIFRAMSKNPALTQKQIAAQADIHPVTLSRILSGAGASDQTIERIAQAIGADAGRIISVGRRVPKFTVKSIEDVIADDRALYQFIGGADNVALEWARKYLVQINQACKERRIQQMRTVAQY